MLRVYYGVINSELGICPPGTGVPSQAVANCARGSPIGIFTISGTRAQARAFMIAENKLVENADWDDQLLAQQLKELSLIGVDFSLELTGFEMGEIGWAARQSARSAIDGGSVTIACYAAPPSTLRLLRP